MGRKATRTRTATGKSTGTRPTRNAQRASTFSDAIFFESPAAFGQWLSANHASQTELFVGYYKKHTGRQVMTWSQAVDEALCWGWIDGQVKGLDTERTAQRFTPRKLKSHWSRINVDKVAVLEAAGRMYPPGREAFARRTEENTAQASFEREALVLSEEFAERLAANPAASTYLESRAQGYRRTVCDWVMNAKRPETREKRLTELIASSEQSMNVKQFRR